MLSPERSDLIPGLEIDTGSKNRYPRNDISFLEKTVLTSIRHLDDETACD